MAATARYIGASGADGVKFHLLHVLRGTDLAADWAAGRVACLDLEAYIAALEACLERGRPLEPAEQERLLEEYRTGGERK